MPQQVSYVRTAWSDRFSKPSAPQLRDGLSPQARRLFDNVRKHLLQLEGIDETTAWYGECWHWSLEYHTRLSKEPLAVLIPCPQDLQLALPVEKEFTASLPLKRMKRAVRDGLELAQEPFDTRWGVWSLAGSSLVDDLEDLVEMKLSHLAGAG